MLRVLIVDDELPFLNYLRAFAWENFSCECVGMAQHGQQALELCETLMPHVVITDVSMPVMDGIEFITRLHQRYPEIRIILLTAYREFNYAQTAVDVGAIAYIVKDIHFEQRLSQALEKARLAFSTQSQESLRESLLSRANRILRVHTTIAEPLAQHLEVEAAVLRHEQGWLLGMKFCLSKHDASMLIEQLDQRHYPFQQFPEIIVYDGGYVEMLFDCSQNEMLTWYEQAVQKQMPPFHAIAVAAWDGPFAGWNEYEQCRSRCLQTIKSTFYVHQSGIIHAKEYSLIRFSASLADEWIHRLEVLGGKRGEIENYLHKTVLPCIEEKRIDPDHVLEMLERWLRRFELRYAQHPALEAREAIRRSVSLKEAVQAFQDGLFSLLPQEEGMSYALLEALTYMREHLKNPNLQLNEVAEHVSISPGHLSKKFKEELQVSYQQMLIRLRMEHAVELLRQPGRRIYEIADSCGYSNYRSFEKAFSAYYGKSPKKFM